MASNVDLFDIVLSFDTTGSMESCLGAVRNRMREMIRKLKSDIPGIKMGVIAHGDYDTDHTYVIKHENLTDNVERLCQFVQNAQGTGGGHARNLDEAYELSLHYTRCKMDWRSNSNRVLVMIGDCRPHEHDYFLNKQRIDWTKEIQKLRDMNVKINAVQCENRSYADSFYQKIASTTFGHHVSLSDIKKIEEVLMSICYREAGLGIKTTPGILKSPIQNYTKPEEITPERLTESKPTVVGPNENSDSDTETEDEDEGTGMKCPLCKVIKPPNEFPTTPVSEDCEHALLECLRCVVKHVKETGKCSDENCDIEVEPNCKMIEFFQAKLDRLFVDYSKISEQQARLMKPGCELISVSTMNGDTVWFPFRANMQIIELKREINEKLFIKVEQQRLIYNDTNLKGDARLSDYNICCNANISLIMPLYCIPEHLDHVVFDLSWEFPAVNPDFLDATCMAFEKDEFVQVIDWTHSTNDYYLKNSVRHSEKNISGPGGKTGRQTIHVYLKSVPKNVTHLYFILSSWRSPNLSDFKNPSLKFYEASSENVNLCETTFVHALNSQAVIMCSTVRQGSKWEIFECGVGSLVEGNAKCYNPIRARIADLIRNEL